MPSRQVGNHLDGRHQPEGDPGRDRRRRRSSSSRSRAATRPAPRRTRANGGSSAPTAPTTTLLADPDDRGGLHLAAEHAARRVVDQSLEAGKHVLCEKPLSRHPGRGRRAAFDAADAGRTAPERGVHVPPQPADEAPRGARRGGRDRRAARRPRGVQLLALRRGQHPPAHRPRRRRADGRRLLLRQRLTPARAASPSPSTAQAWFGPTGTDWVFGGTLALRGRRARGSSTAAPPCPSATSSRRSAATARCSSTIRGTARARRSSCGATARPSGSRSSRRTPTGSSSRTCRDAIRGEGELLLGRDDAVGQARTLEALHSSATTGNPVALTR